MKNQKKNQSQSGENDLPGYPVYPAKEDIFNAGREERDLDPENPSEVKTADSAAGDPEELLLSTDLSGEGLDVPGSEEDDKMEDIGSEDEENNFYSLGGDNHDT